MDAHLKECDYQLVPCEFSHIGCKAMFTEGERSKHNQKCALKHVGLLKKALQKKDETIASLRKQLSKEPNENEVEKKEEIAKYDEKTVPKKMTAKFRWDKFNNGKGQFKISEEGTRLKGASASPIANKIVGSVGYNKGINIFQIICHKRFVYFGVGITTDNNLKKGSNCMCQMNLYSNGLSYVWDAECGHMIEFNDQNKEYRKKDVGKWRTGDKMTLAIDCEKWKLVIWKGDNHLFTFDLAPNRTYYPLLGCGGSNSDYKLVTA